jgi:hypothetical protein
MPMEDITTSYLSISCKQRQQHGGRENLWGEGDTSAIEKHETFAQAVLYEMLRKNLVEVWIFSLIFGLMVTTGKLLMLCILSVVTR